jgi:pimeloyl-ACP methyl ester carboxylesterase
MIVIAFLLALLTSAGAPTQTFDAGIMRVERFGNPAAPPIIFIPGLACGPWIWDAQIAELSPKYDVYAVTLPGFDGRPMIGGNQLMLRAVTSLHELIVSQHLRRPIVVGHSLGGTLAVLFGETYPHGAANIVSVEGGYPIARTQALRDAAVARSTAPYENISQRQLSGALRTNMLQYTITRPADVDRATQLAGKSDPKAIVAWMRAALSLDLSPRLSRISAPFTAIVPFDAQIDPYQGFKTFSAKRAAYEAWVARVPEGKLEMIDGARHFVMLDRPGEFEAALDAAIVR